MSRTSALRLFTVLLIATVALLAPQPAASAEKRAQEIKLIQHFREKTWHWQRVVGIKPTPSNRSEKKAGPAYRRWVLRLWERRAEKMLRKAKSVPYKPYWLCIHRYEGAWNANTGNGYYGGLQMDITFQRTYGWYLLNSKGTADRWTPNEQMWVAERARRSGRGFYPWPNTARYCGLI